MKELYSFKVQMANAPILPTEPKIPNYQPKLSNLIHLFTKILTTSPNYQNPKNPTFIAMSEFIKTRSHRTKSDNI